MGAASHVSLLFVKALLITQGKMNKSLSALIKYKKLAKIDKLT